MARYLRVTLTILALLTGTFGFTKSHNVNGVVLKITDGDTIWVQPNGTASKDDKLKIRMMNVDAPETHLPTKNNGVVSQGWWGDKATEHLESLIPLKSRVVVEDFGIDKYRRTLARIFKGREDINLTMVRNGWAAPYIICSGSECDPGFERMHHVQEYIEACEEAQEKERGIFDSRRPLKEMPFEFRLRMQERKYDKYVGNFANHRLYGPSEYHRVPLCQRVFFLTTKDAKRAGYQKAASIPAFFPLEPSFH